MQRVLRREPLAKWRIGAATHSVDCRVKMTVRSAEVDTVGWQLTSARGVKHQRLEDRDSELARTRSNMKPNMNWRVNSTMSLLDYTQLTQARSKQNVLRPLEK